MAIGCALGGTCSAEPRRGDAVAGRAHCSITAESIDADPDGLRVHQAPNVKSAVVGRLYPSMDPETFYHDEKASLADGLVGAMFTVEAVAGEWLRVADVDPISDGVSPDGKDLPNYQGTGWVHASKARLIPTNSVKLHEQPRESSKRIEGGWDVNSRIVGCRGSWAEIQLAKGATGWLPSESNKARTELIRRGRVR
jgi:hypothetical protein